MKKTVLLALPVLVFMAALVTAGIPQEKVKSRAYVGHENDRDILNFILQYPKAAGTRLDERLASGGRPETGDLWQRRPRTVGK